MVSQPLDLNYISGVNLLHYLRICKDHFREKSRRYLIFMITIFEIKKKLTVHHDSTNGQINNTLRGANVGWNIGSQMIEGKTPRAVKTSRSLLNKDLQFSWWSWTILRVRRWKLIKVITCPYLKMAETCE